VNNCHRRSYITQQKLHHNTRIFIAENYVVYSTRFKRNINDKRFSQCYSVRKSSVKEKKKEIVLNSRSELIATHTRTANLSSHVGCGRRDWQPTKIIFNWCTIIIDTLWRSITLSNRRENIFNVVKRVEPSKKQTKNNNKNIRRQTWWFQSQFNYWYDFMSTYDINVYG